MKIDNVNIKEFNAKQLTVDFQPPSFSVNTEWPDGSLVPYEYPTHCKFGRLTLTLLIRGEDRNEVQRSISRITALLTRTVRLTLDNYRGTYIGSLVSSSAEKTLTLTRKILRLEFNGYMQSEEIVKEFNNVTAAELKVYGTRESPCIIEITPDCDIENFTISGFGEDDIVILQLNSGETLIIDGAKGTATVNGENAFASVDLWRFPSLIPGEDRSIEFSSDLCKIKIRYSPMWL